MLLSLTSSFPWPNQYSPLFLRYKSTPNCADSWRTQLMMPSKDTTNTFWYCWNFYCWNRMWPSCLAHEGNSFMLLSYRIWGPFTRLVLGFTSEYLSHTIHSHRGIPCLLMTLDVRAYLPPPTSIYAHWACHISLSHSMTPIDKLPMGFSSSSPARSTVWPSLGSYPPLFLPHTIYQQSIQRQAVP